MTEHNTLIALSAFAGLAGAILSQLMTGLFSFVNDRRKHQHELRQKFRTRKTEVGENFYFMTGERMTLIQNTIRYWKNWNDTRSESSLSFLNQEMVKLSKTMEELNSENWKYNLAGLYLNIGFTYRDILAAKAISHRHYLKVLDIGDKLKKCDASEKEQLQGAYACAVFDMCAHYEQVYSRMEQDMIRVKEELLHDYALH